MGIVEVRCRASWMIEFFAQDFAADGQACFGVAEGAEERGIEAGFAGDLSHDLHEAPAEAAGVGFGGGDFVVGVERRDVFGEEGRFVAHRPGVPAGFLFDDGADQCGVEGLGGGGFVSEGDEFWGNAHAEIEMENSEEKQILACLRPGKAGAQQCCAPT